MHRSQILRLASNVSVRPDVLVLLVAVLAVEGG